MNPATPQHPGHRALRTGRSEIPGQVYLLTTGTHQRRAWFAQHPTARAAARCLGSAQAWQDHRVLAWVLMPDHCHLLIQLGPSASLARAVQRMKSLTARAANAALGRTGPVWQPAYHDHALHNEEDLRAAARYLVGNPVRAGLVARVGEYPYWDAAWLSSIDGVTDPVPPAEG